MFKRSMTARTAVLALVITAAALLSRPTAVLAAGDFPYDQEMILEAPRIGGLKRLPILTVEPNGNAVIDLWCRSVPGRVQVTDNTIKIETAPLPVEMPSMMVTGQCSPERTQADQDLLAALTQVTSWQWKGNLVVFDGSAILKFLPSSH